MIELTKEQIANRIAKNVADFLNTRRNSTLVNLGIGIPSRVSNFIVNPNVYLHAENGLIGVGRFAETEDEKDYNCVNAGRQLVTEIDGCSYVDSAMSFGLIRGGHVDVTVLGAFEVDKKANVANWIIPNGKQLGVGGAMDLIVGAKKVVIAMTHTNRGKSKLVEECTLPITGFAEADMVVTELCVLEFRNEKYVLTRIAKELTVDELRNLVEFEFDVSDELSFMLD